jgi:hypothetical protein
VIARSCAELASDTGVAAKTKAANNWQLAVAGGQTLVSINRYVHTQITPTVCGGGGFLFLGAQGQKGGTQGFAGGLLEYDTRAGWSLSGLFEGTRRPWTSPEGDGADFPVATSYPAIC